MDSRRKNGLLIEPAARVLFQGDSITDCGRNYGAADDLGLGYAMMAAAWFSALYPERQVHFINRGVGGNRIIDLCARWQADCLDIRPTWVSLLIGINDTWRRYDSGDPTTVQDFEAAYRTILDDVQRHLAPRLILLEPFVLPVPPDRVAWREDLDPKIAVVRKLAREYQALLVPLDGLFAAATQREPAFWTADGVHPTPAGHALIAQAWLQTVHAI